MGIGELMSEIVFKTQKPDVSISKKISINLFAGGEIGEIQEYTDGIDDGDTETDSFSSR